jgi:DNA-binding GntR family transcriptional regulator
VREALGRLAADGLVDLLPGRGARVAGVRAQDMADAYAARLAVEPAAAALAAARRPAGAVAEMRAAVAAHRAARTDPAATFGANRAFHLALVRGSANPYLTRFAATLWAGRVGLAVFEAQAEPPDRIARDADDHEAIAGAVAAGDAAAAEALTRGHVAGALELLRARVDA